MRGELFIQQDFLCCHPEIYRLATFCEFIVIGKDRVDKGNLWHFQQEIIRIGRSQEKLQDYLLLWVFTAHPVKAGAHHCSSELRRIAHGINVPFAKCTRGIPLCIAT
jgi:hypothetical protein